jgi:DnaJ-class molecular chaperone
VSSNYEPMSEADWVHEAEMDELLEAVDMVVADEVAAIRKTRTCTACRGSGLVEVDGWETDCIECEGWGDFEIT